jgi:MFS family permease
MNAASRGVQRIYLLLVLLHTLAASLIWGVNTLFLLDAGLSNTEAFAANAFFTAGMVLFEVPTGVVADMRGRRISYLLGTLTLAISTVIYLLMWRMHAAFWAWAVTSMFLGLGFTFFSGATQAWLVDALTDTGYRGKLDSVFAKGQIVEGSAMLTGSVVGGFIAQRFNLGAPYIVRAGVLLLSFTCALLLMRDRGFTPKAGKHPIREIGQVLHASIQYGLGSRPVRWVMLTGMFSGAVMIYAFYAMQPYLLELYGDTAAYGVAGLAAAIVAGAQIAGGLLVPHLGRVFKRRTSVLLWSTVFSAIVLTGIGLLPRFWIVIALLVVWGLMFAATTPVHQAFVNALIPSDQRATVLSFDNLLASTGGVVSQPLLGRAADVWGYPASYLCCGAIQALGIPFALLARRENASSDPIEDSSDESYTD